MLEAAVIALPPLAAAWLGLAPGGVPLQLSHSLFLLCISGAALLMDRLVRDRPAGHFGFRPMSGTGLVAAVTLMPLLAMAIDTRHRSPLLVAAAARAAPTLLTLVGAWYTSSLRLRSTDAGMVLVAAASWALPWLFIEGVPWHHSWALTVCLVVASLMWLLTVRSLPLCFTAGEAWLVVQGAAVALLAVSDDLLFRVVGFYPPFWPSNFLAQSLHHSQWNISTRIVAASIWGVAVAVAVGTLVSRIPGVRSNGLRPDTTFESWRRSLAVLGAVGLTCLFVVLPVTSVYIRQDVLTWFIAMVEREQRLFGFAIAAAIVQVSIVVLFRKQLTASNRLMWRKAFHLIVLSIFFPLMVMAPEFITTMSAFAFVVFVLAELVRVLQLQPFSALLEEMTNMFRDERDAGPVLMTPIYLLLGCAGPIWVTMALGSPRSASQALGLPAFAGLLALGVGDAAAAYVGSRYGRIRIFGNVKTLEGCIGGALAQLLVAMALVHFGYVNVAASSWSHVGLALALGSLYEGATNQIDNLVLPLYTLAALLACP